MSGSSGAQVQPRNEDLPVVRKVKAQAPTKPAFYVAIKIYSIADIDDKTQTFTTHFRLFIEWLNEAGLSSDRLPWPKVNLLNQVDAKEGTFVERLPKVRKKDGWYEQKNNYVAKFACSFDLTVFPFDNQDLQVHVRVSHYLAPAYALDGQAESGSLPVTLLRGMKRPATAVKKVNRDVLQTSNHAHTRDWIFEDPSVGFELSGADAQESAGGPVWQDVIWTVRASREYVSHAWNVFSLIFPLQVLGLCTYFIQPPPCEPDDSCENAAWMESHYAHVDTRIQVVLTLLLTSVAFKITLSENMPSIPYLTLLDRYLLACNVLFELLALEIFTLGRLATATGIMKQDLDAYLFLFFFVTWFLFQLYYFLWMWNEAHVGGSLEEPLVVGPPLFPFLAGNNKVASTSSDQPRRTRIDTTAKQRRTRVDIKTRRKSILNLNDAGRRESAPAAIEHV